MGRKLKDMEQEDLQIREDEDRAKSRASYCTSIWVQSMENAEKANAQKRQERLQQRTNRSIKMSWTKDKLKRSQNEYERLLGLQSQERKMQAARTEAKLEAAMEREAQEAARMRKAKEKEEAETLAREREARRREAEARQREVEQEREKLQAAREKARISELKVKAREEAARRQCLLERISEQKTESLTKASYSTAASKSKSTETESKASFTNNQDSRRSKGPRPRCYQFWFRTGNSTSAYDPLTSNWRPGERNQAAEKEEKNNCGHRSFWSKVKGGQPCSKCSRFCNTYIFKCPGCGILACASCRARFHHAAS